MAPRKALSLSLSREREQEGERETLKNEPQKYRQIQITLLTTLFRRARVALAAAATPALIRAPQHESLGCMNKPPPSITSPSRQTKQDQNLCRTTDLRSQTLASIFTAPHPLEGSSNPWTCLGHPIPQLSATPPCNRLPRGRCGRMVGEKVIGSRVEVKLFVVARLPILRRRHHCDSMAYNAEGTMG